MILANAFCIVLFVGEWPQRGCAGGGGCRLAEVARPQPPTSTGGEGLRQRASPSERGVQLHFQFPVNLKRGGGHGGHTRGTPPSRPLGAGAGSITPQPSPARPPSLPRLSNQLGVAFWGRSPPFFPFPAAPPTPPPSHSRGWERGVGTGLGKLGSGMAGAAGWARSSVPGERSCSPGSLSWRDPLARRARPARAGFGVKSGGNGKFSGFFIFCPPRLGRVALPVPFAAPAARGCPGGDPSSLQSPENFVGPAWGQGQRQ